MTEDDYIAYAENLSLHLKSLETEADKETDSNDGKEGYKQAHHAHSLPAYSQDPTQKRNREDPLNNAPASKNYKRGFQKTCLQHASANWTLNQMKRPHQLKKPSLQKVKVVYMQKRSQSKNHSSKTFFTSKKQEETETACFEQS
jgi:hypothetical protein